MSWSDPSVAREQATTEMLRGVCARLAKDGASGSVEEVSDENLSKLIGAALGLFVARVEGGRSVPPFDTDTELTATDVLIVVSALLDAVNLETFELALWQSFGAPQTHDRGPR